MTRTGTAVTIAEHLTLPAMKLLASLNLLFLVSFIIVFCVAAVR